jgi:hypothetical protein
MNNGMKVDQNSSAHCNAQPFELGNVACAQQIFTADIRIMQQDGYARR